MLRAINDQNSGIVKDIIGTCKADGFQLAYYVNKFIAKLVYSHEEAVSIRRLKGFYVNYALKFKRGSTKTVGVVYYFYNTYTLVCVSCFLFSSISTL